MTQLALFETPQRDGRVVRWELAFSSEVEDSVFINCLIWTADMALRSRRTRRTVDLV